MNEESLLKRLDAIEHKLGFLAEAYTLLHNRVIQGIEIQFDRQLLAPQIARLNNSIKDFADLVKNDSMTGTISFIGKRLHEMAANLREIKEEGIKKNIHLDLTMDGYEMVKKKRRIPDVVEEEQIAPEELVSKLLEYLLDTESQVVLHRYGLFDNSKKTLSAIGKLMKISAERVGQLHARALRKLKHPARRDLVESLTHKELREAILGTKK